jgi:hypothetical protein
MTPASRAGQLFSRFERRTWTALWASRGVRAAILDCGVERLADVGISVVVDEGIDGDGGSSQAAMLESFHVECAWEFLVVGCMRCVFGCGICFP